MTGTRTVNEVVWPIALYSNVHLRQLEVCHTHRDDRDCDRGSNTNTVTINPVQISLLFSKPGLEGSFLFSSG